MNKKIKINILSHGRFHMLDLARELDKNGFDVKFYSFVPKSRCSKFGLPSKCCVSLFYYMAPILLFKNYFPILDNIRRTLQDFLIKLFMRKCDILISLTGFIYAPLSAKKNGSIIIYERGSKHILEQKKILDKYKKSSIPNTNIRLNIKAYQIADYISVASNHVAQSFKLHNFDSKKIFINPYGVDLSMFFYNPNTPKDYDVIMVGGWSWRKGCDLIVEAIKKTDYRFLHVGGLVDIPFPSDKQFTHIPPVDQKQLVKYYNSAKIFILPSREEGLAMVQAQAIACNLPLVGSKDSGAEDLKQMVDEPEFITIIQDYTPEALIEAMNIAMNKSQELKGKSYAGDAIKNLAWDAYGKRYSNFLHKILNT